MQMLCFTRFCYVRSFQCWSCWFQASVFLAHGESCRIELGDVANFCTTNGSHQIIAAQLRPSLGGSLGFHLGCTWASRVSPAPPLGASWDPLVPLLGPTWTILDLPGHLEAPLSSSWFVLGFDGRSRGSIFTPQDRIQDQVDVIFRSRLICVG